MAKHISKKKKKSKVIISSESTADENETIPETPEADLQKSASEESRTSDIFVNVSHTDANVTMGEDASHTTVQGKISDVTPDIIVSLPPQLTPITPTTSTNDSHTFANIIKQSIISLFSSQSTDPPTTTSPIQDSSFMETEHESEGTSLEVDGLLKMLEGRISSKVSGMIKDSESRLLEKIDLCDHSNEMRVNAQKSTFEGDMKELKLVTKERHVLFVQDVKKVREDVN
ncbi:unnamed protein product [Lactuca saligna]|uniref:Uncharacterized protein n=1 Tax=Lactuca saligna TaxID=75948 RepID=A0AA36E3A2_LACSI|nr:unnamed protein product [Lactuca saligna]